MFFKELGLDWKQTISSQPKFSPNPNILMWGPPWKPHVMEASSIKVMIIFFSIQHPVHVKGCDKEAEVGVFPGYYKCGP